MMADAIYSTAISSGTSFSCRIPKKRGVGFLKSVMGWHLINEAGRAWINHHPEAATGDYTDIDGYLDIQLRMFRWDAGYAEGIETVKQALMSIFPQITGWREVGLEELFR